MKLFYFFLIGFDIIIFVEGIDLVAYENIQLSMNGEIY